MAAAWQTRGRKLEPVTMRYIFSGKVPSAWIASCYYLVVFFYFQRCRFGLIEVQ